MQKYVCITSWVWLFFEEVLTDQQGLQCVFQLYLYSRLVEG